MSAHNELFLGHAAMVDEDYEAAFKHYSSAIELEPNNADCYSKRAASQLKRCRFAEAASDATVALKIEPSAKAYQRKAIACFNLNEFESARAAFSKALEFEGIDTRELKRWVRKCDAEMQLEALGTATPAPSTDISTGAPSRTSDASASGAAAPSASPPSAAAPSAAAPVIDPSRIRHEW